MSNPERQNNPRKGLDGRGIHDLGGLDLGPVDRTEHDPVLWEKRVDAMLILLVSPKRAVFTVDAMRRVIEEYHQQDYDSIGYYDKWIKAVRNLLIEQEVLTRGEVEARMADVRKRARTEGRTVSEAGVP